MSPIFQQRLIGSVLLLCLLGGIAFFLINSANNDEEIVPEALPDIPFTSNVDMAIPDGDVEIIDDVEETLVDPQQLDTKPEVVQPEVIATPKPIIEQHTPPTADNINAVDETSTTQIVSWSLQIASFSVEANAESLRKQIQALGYKAIVEKGDTPKGPRFRVRIGPQQDKQALEAIAKVLKEKLNLNPQILKQS